MREAIDELDDVAVIGPEFVGRPGVAGWDPLRIVLDVRATGRSGYVVAAALRATYDIHVELATHATLVLVLGIGQPVEALERVAHDLPETIERLRGPGTAEAVARPVAAFSNEMAIAPRDAFLGETEVVPVDDAVGRVSSEAIAGYPPGIPALLPGRAHHPRGRRLPPRARGLGCPPARRERPELRHDQRLGLAPAPHFTITVPRMFGWTRHQKVKRPFRSKRNRRLKPTGVVLSRSRTPEFQNALPCVAGVRPTRARSLA